MLTATITGLPVAFDTRSASSKLRCHWISTGFFQPSSLAAGHMSGSVRPCCSCAGEPYLKASSEGAAPPAGRAPGACWPPPCVVEPCVAEPCVVEPCVADSCALAPLAALASWVLDRAGAVAASTPTQTKGSNEPTRVAWFFTVAWLGVGASVGLRRGPGTWARGARSNLRLV
jgi:hypothetical protein